LFAWARIEAWQVKQSAGSAIFKLFFVPECPLWQSLHETPLILCLLKFQKGTAFES
jgi:hypothetical protein